MYSDPRIQSLFVKRTLFTTCTPVRKYLATRMNVESQSVARYAQALGDASRSFRGQVASPSISDRLYSKWRLLRPMRRDRVLSSITRPTMPVWWRTIKMQIRYLWGTYGPSLQQRPAYLPPATVRFLLSRLHFRHGKRDRKAPRTAQPAHMLVRTPCPLQ